LFDYRMFQQCYSGADVPAIAECLCFDDDADGDVDGGDFSAFALAMTGP